MQSLQPYLDLYAAQAALLDGGSHAVLNAPRAAAAAALAAGGLPTRRTERYRYVDLEPVLAPDYGLNLRRTLPAGDLYARFRCNVPGLQAAQALVVNDVVCPAAPGAPALPPGVEVTSLTAAARADEAYVASRYHQAAARSYDAVAALSAMLAQDGVLVRVAPGVRAERPVQVLGVAAADAALMSNRRLLVDVADGADVTVLVCEHAPGQQTSLTTLVVEAYVGRGARLGLCFVEQTGTSHNRLARLCVEQQAESRVDCHVVSLGGGLSRLGADFVLAGPGAELRADGAVVAGGGQTVDYNLLVEHAAPQCASDLLFKYVLSDQATGAYAGRVLVQPGAGGTASEQRSAGLCASPQAHLYAQPMLEIYADDVQCNHGSTVGQLDEAALFYMRQRGIDEAEARLLLQHAFVNEVLRRVEPEQLRSRLASLVDARFRGTASRCHACALCP